MVTHQLVRVVRQTVLVAGGGYAEEAFLKHLRGLYTSKASGRSVTVRNARGTLAAHVVSETYRMARQLQHTHVVALLDAYTDIDGAATADARKKKIVPVSCDPCIEALLLRMHGDNAERDAAGHKAAFEVKFGMPAHDARVYARHFSREVVDVARLNCPELNVLLGAFGC